MASRRRRSRLDRGARPGSPFFRPVGRPLGTAGRVPWRSSLRSELLRPVPLGFNVRQYSRPLRPLPDVLRARRARIAPTAVLHAGVRQAQPVRLVRALLPLGKPVLSRRSTPCDRRRDRKEVMFAAGVAGRRWSRGGPRMRGARVSVDSQYSCR